MSKMIIDFELLLKYLRSELGKDENKKVKKLYAHHTSCKYLKTEDHHVLVSSNDVCKVLVGTNL